MPDWSATTCALTVDVEDWFHGLDLPVSAWEGLERRVEAATDRLLELLAEHGARATFFVLGRVADDHPDLVWRILSAGHEVGSHGYLHEFAYRQTPDTFARDLDASLVALDRAGAPTIRSYRAPFFSITRRSLWALDRLAAAGIVRDSSVIPATNPRYGIRTAPLAPHRVSTPEGRELLEVPVSCLAAGPLRVPFGGGFYMRFFSLRTLRAAISLTRAQRRPVVLYVHPWELDPDHPRIDLPRRVAMTHYHHLDGTRTKLASLLADSPWTALSDCFRVEPGDLASGDCEPRRDI